jgi:hypothetical protein
MTEDSSEGYYDSAFLFPSTDEPCTCVHGPIEHSMMQCEAKGCHCKAYWERS